MTETVRRRHLIRLDEPAALDPRRVGRKAAALARARRAGLPVPPTLVVPVAPPDAGGDGVSPALAGELAAVAVELGLETGLAVRSSALAEDLAAGSFAGVYASFLDVRGEDDLIRAVEGCRASARAGQVRAYLAERGLTPGAAAMAVILQPMIAAVAAGVAFSRNPIHPTRDEVVIEAVPGLGDRLAAGAVSPHRAFLAASGPPRVEWPGGGPATSPPLEEAGWRQVADLARRAEELTGAPQDIEWALDRQGRLWLLQCRPVTALDGTGAGIAAPPGIWTRALAVDLWADRLTPFLARVMLEGAPRWDLTPAAERMGMPVARPTLAVIGGYLYVNVESLRGAVSALPRPLRLPRLGELFPPGLPPEDLPFPGVVRLASLGLRALAYSLATPQSNPLFCPRITRRRMRSLEAETEALAAAPAGSPRATLARVRRAVDLLVRHQEANQWGYTWATVLTWAFRHLLTARGELAEEGFLELLGAGADNVTLSIEREFRRLAGRVAADAELRRRLETEGPAALLSATCRLRPELDLLIRRFGRRARCRSLSVPRWTEAPGEVAALVAGLVPGLARGEGQPGRPRRHRRRPARELWRRLPPLRRFLLRRLQRLARRYLDLREELRFHLDGALFLLRRTLLDLGEATGLGDRVFDLTLDELAEALEGGIAAAAAVAGRRRRERPAAAGAPPGFYVAGRPVDGLPSHRGDLLRGLGTSPGRARGRARVVTIPTDAALADGDVLVGVHADPGWTPLLPRVAGIVLEEGGLLNHCSIVARELGVPAVVGVREATRRIRDGATVTLDGGQGWVQLSDEDLPC